MYQELTVDLRRPPHDRWHFTPTQRLQARELLAIYKRDLNIPEEVARFLCNEVKTFVLPNHWLEMESLATAFELSLSDVAVCNFYYDALKVVLGCSAFAVDADGSVLHARNLDWWTEDRVLARYT